MYSLHEHPVYLLFIFLGASQPSGFVPDLVTQLINTTTAPAGELTLGPGPPEQARALLAA